MPLGFSSPLKIATFSVSTVLILTMVAIGINQLQSHLEKARSQGLEESLSERSNSYTILENSSPSTSNGVGCSVDLQRCPI
jgi:hypothetical protein